jgi:hypothetical protein
MRLRVLVSAMRGRAGYRHGRKLKAANGCR